MRKGAWLESVLLALAGCSGGYPIAPTLCDDWCDATHAMQCDYDPAGCVTQCEEARGRIAYDCDPEIRGVATCYRAHPEELVNACSFDSYKGPCGSARYQANDCIGGAPRGYSNCYEVCLYLGNSSCPRLTEVSACAMHCAATGQGSVACAAARQAVIACAANVASSCDTFDRAELDLANAPCQAELALLRDCGASS